MREVVDKTKMAIGYFNNHFHGYAVENCLQVLRMLGLSNPKQDEVQNSTTNYINGKAKEESTKTKILSLDDFNES